MVAFAWAASGVAITVPAGWSEVFVTVGTSNVSNRTVYKISTGESSTSGWTGAERLNLHVLRGTRTVEPIIGYSVASSGTGSNLVYGSMSVTNFTNQTSSWLIRAGAIGAITGTLDAPTGFTTRIAANNGTSVRAVSHDSNGVVTANSASQSVAHGAGAGITYRSVGLEVIDASHVLQATAPLAETTRVPAATSTIALHESELAEPPLIDDTFDGRTVAAGSWGTSSDGKVWTFGAGSGANAAVANGVGTAIALLRAIAPGDAAGGAFFDAKIRLTALPASSYEEFIFEVGDPASTLNGWQAKFRLYFDGTVQFAYRRHSSNFTNSTTRLTGVTANAWVRVRAAITWTGVATGYIRMAVWLDGAAEPSTFALSIGGTDPFYYAQPRIVTSSVSTGQWEFDWVRIRTYGTSDGGIVATKVAAPTNVNHTRTATDTLTTGAGTVARTIGRVRTTADTTTTTDTVARSATMTRTVTDTVTVGADTPVRRVTFARVHTDTVGLGADVTTATVRGPPQVLRPAADLSGTTWRAEDLRTTNLYASVSDDTDSTWVESPLSPTAADTQVFTLPTATDPGTDLDHVITYRYSGSGGADIVVELLQDTTVIAAWTHTDPARTAATATQTLTPEQAATITNYGLLRLRVRGA